MWEAVVEPDLILSSHDYPSVSACISFDTNEAG